MNLQPNSKDSKFIYLTKSLLKKYKEEDIDQISAQLAYFSILSIFPFLIFLNAIIGKFHISIGATLSDISLFLPDNISEIINAYVHYIGEKPSTSLLSFGLISTIYLASKSSKSFINAINRIYKHQHNMSIVKVNIISILITLSMGLTIIISIVTLTLGNNIIIYLLELFNLPLEYAYTWAYMRWTIIILAMVLNLWMIYYFLPTRKASIFHALPGTIFSSLLFTLMSLIYSIYVNNFANYNAVYGSLGGIIVFMIWLYVVSTMLLLGVCVNYIIENNSTK